MGNWNCITTPLEEEQKPNTTQQQRHVSPKRPHKISDAELSSDSNHNMSNSLDIDLDLDMDNEQQQQSKYDEFDDEVNIAVIDEDILEIDIEQEIDDPPEQMQPHQPYRNNSETTQQNMVISVSASASVSRPIQCSNHNDSRKKEHKSDDADAAAQPHAHQTNTEDETVANTVDTLWTVKQQQQLDNHESHSHDQEIIENENIMSEILLTDDDLHVLDIDHVISEEHTHTHTHTHTVSTNANSSAADEDYITDI